MWVAVCFLSFFFSLFLHSFTRLSLSLIFSNLFLVRTSLAGCAHGICSHIVQKIKKLENIFPLTATLYKWHFCTKTWNKTRNMCPYQNTMHVCQYSLSFMFHYCFITAILFYYLQIIISGHLIFDLFSVLSHNVYLLAGCLFTAMLLFSNSELTLPFTRMLLMSFILTLCHTISSGTEPGGEVNWMCFYLYISLNIFRALYLTLL